jgi:two-component sensor histidine kinase
VARSGIGEIVSDITKDNRYFLDDQSRLSEITVPVISNGVVIGIIDSEHHQKNFFSSDDLKTLTTIASMTSSRLAQAFAVEKLNEQQQVLEESVRSKTKELHMALNHLQITNIKLSSSNDEKDILLKEVHHRVKNNMQIITSLLTLQSFNIEDKKTRDLFDNSQYRINAMALIHEMLYQSDNLSMINYADYLKLLINNLLTSFKGVEHNINLSMDITEMYLNIDTAISLGLMINEIITNSLKYAFCEDKPGSLSLKIFEGDEQDTFIMEIGDNGPGFSDDIFKSGKKTLGMQLIYKLIKQINGEINRNMEKKGTHYHIYFENV